MTTHTVESLMQRLSELLRSAPNYDGRIGEFESALRAALVQPAADPQTGNWINMDDHYRHVRELDVALNGEDGAAQRPLLIDVLSQVQDIVRKTGRPLLAAQPAAEPLCEVTPAQEWTRSDDGRNVYGDERDIRLDIDGNWANDAERKAFANRLCDLLNPRAQPAQDRLAKVHAVFKGARVEGDTVVITVRGGNDVARWLCGELVKEIENERQRP